MVIPHGHRSISMENENIALMYRRPGVEEHENITDVLDDVIISIQYLSRRVEELTEKVNSLQQN